MACQGDDAQVAAGTDSAGSTESGDNPSGEPDTGGASSTGEQDEVDACAVRYLWEPGVGDISSFPTAEMVTPDSASPTGYVVSVSADSYPDLSAYGVYAEDVGTALSSLDGFGIQGEAFARFDAPLDPTAVPASTGIADRSDTIGIVVMPADGDAFLIPVGVELTDEGETVLAYPMSAMPPGTNVAFWVKRSFGTQDEQSCVGASQGMRALLDQREQPFDDALNALEDLGVIEGSDDLAVLQPYPTQSATRESLAIAKTLQEQPSEGLALSNFSCEPSKEFNYCTSTLSVFDYRNADGVVTVDVNAVQGQAPWDLTVHAWLPLEAGPAPTILFGHGLGGDATQAEALAGESAPRGYVTVAISALMHGDHPSLEGETLADLQTTLAFFAVDLTLQKVDAPRLRDHFRQSTYDKLSLTRLLRTGPDLDGDGAPDVDPAALSYLGVSLGAIMGSEFLALTDAYSGGVLIMPGGRLSVLMTDPAGGFQALLDIVVPAELTDGEQRRLFAILQTVLDAGDPATYARQILNHRASFAPEVPDMLVGVALQDGTVVNSATWALARSMDLPLVEPVLLEVPGLDITETAPVNANMPGGVTAGMLQFDVIRDGAGTTPVMHRTLPFSDVGLAAWMSFMDTLFADASATIIDPYMAVGLDHG